MSKSNYQLVVKLSIDAMDDIDARQKAQQLIKHLDIVDGSLKLQRIYQDKEPVGITINL